MIKLKKIERIVGRSLIKVSCFRPRMSTKVGLYFYSRWGMRLSGKPNYISHSAWFDGADMSLITLSEGCTISSKTSFLTHDWSLYNIGKALGDDRVPVKARSQEIIVGPYSFVGRGAILMPGCVLGRGVVVGAGAVVRGSIDDYSIVIGNPGTVVGDSRKYYEDKVHILKD